MQRGRIKHPPPSAPALRPYRPPGQTSTSGMAQGLRSPYGFRPRMWSSNQSNHRVQNCGNVSVEPHPMKETSNRPSLIRPSPVRCHGQRQAVPSCGQIRMQHPSNVQFQRHPRPTGQSLWRPPNLGGSHIQNKPNVQPNQISQVQSSISGNRHDTGPVARSSMQQSSSNPVGVGSRSQQNSFVHNQNEFTLRRPVQEAAAIDRKVSSFRTPGDGRVRQEEPNVNRQESVDLWVDGKNTIRNTRV